MNDVVLPLTRREALQLGLTRYLGRPCKLHGHHSGRSVANRGCIQCDLQAKHRRTKVGQMRGIGVTRVGDSLTLAVPSHITLTITYIKKAEKE